VGVLGGTPRKIVEDGRYPAPSPDGKRLAYVSFGETIDIANADGTGARQIAAVRGAQYPQWSPDGRWLAYTAGSLFDTYQISIIDPDGKNQRPLTSFATGSIFCAAWLPGGRRIIFAYNPSPAPDGADLLSVSVDGGEIRRLTLIPKGAFTSCNLSADGKRLVGQLRKRTERFGRHRWERIGNQGTRRSPSTGPRLGADVDPSLASRNAAVQQSGHRHS